MRLFFGLEPDQDTLLSLANWRDRHLSCAARPVPPANFHLTLAFIGNAQQGQLDALCQAVDRWCESAHLRSGLLHLDQVGYWPRPGILWLGPSHWPQQLSAIAHKLQNIAHDLGAKKDSRRYQPHITLYRGCVDAPALPPTAPAIDFPYRHFTLFESRQGRRGVSYHPLFDWSLAH